MKLPRYIDSIIDTWYIEDVLSVDDEFVVPPRDTFYCCNCTRHLDKKFMAHIIGRRQKRCIDCNAIIKGRLNAQTN